MIGGEIRSVRPAGAVPRIVDGSSAATVAKSATAASPRAAASTAAVAQDTTAAPAKDASVGSVADAKAQAEKLASSTRLTQVTQAQIQRALIGVFHTRNPQDSIRASVASTTVSLTGAVRAIETAVAAATEVAAMQGVTSVVNNLALVVDAATVAKVEDAVRTAYAALKAQAANDAVGGVAPSTMAMVPARSDNATASSAAVSRVAAP